MICAIPAPGTSFTSKLKNSSGEYHLTGFGYTVKILKIGTPEIITITVLHLEQLDFTVQHCVQQMQIE